MTGQTPDRTDFRNPDRLVELHGDDLRFVGTWGKGLAFDGKRWALDDCGRWQQCAADTARVLFDDGLADLRDAVSSGDAERVALARSRVAWGVRSQGAARLA